MKTLLFALTLVMFVFSLPAIAVEVRDGKLVTTFPQEDAVLKKCDEQGGCFIVSREIVQKYAEAYAAEQVELLRAEVREQFAAAVAAEAKAQAAKICRNTT